MCGIAGFAGAGTQADLRAMADAIRHRGPDGEGFHVDAKGRVHLAHRRLAIIDIAGGEQPMWNEDESIAVVFNGEIYNHLELRAMLVARGHAFRSDHSDTEVLVHGYEEWGDELPSRLNGMFAFAVWDSRRGRLFLARDRFGKKPLYYCSQPGVFAFASELTALQRHPSVPTDIDRRSLQKLLAYGFVPAPRSLYRGIERLPVDGAAGRDLDHVEIERSLRQIGEQDGEGAPRRRGPVPIGARDMRAGRAVGDEEGGRDPENAGQVHECAERG